jgi:hypothetical protein
MTDSQRDQLDAVLLICAEVERHANAIDPSDPTAASVLVELNLDLVSGLRILCKVVRETADSPPNQIFAGPKSHMNGSGDHPAPIIIDEADEPVSLMDDEVAA